MPKAGEPAPGFTLDGSDGTETGRRPYSLEEFRGEPVVLVFYPADNSPVCTVQLRSYSADIASFAETGAQVLAISPQSVAAHDSPTPAANTPANPASKRTDCRGPR